MYVWYGTNEFNFVKLKNPPEYEPTRCTQCHRIIRLAGESYSTKGGGSCLCERCTANAIARRRLM
jgi:hypothetical protein